MQVETRIEEPSIPLDSWHIIIARYDPTPYVPWEKTSCFGLDRKLGFCLVRHGRIFAIGGQKQLSGPCYPIDILITSPMPRYTFSNLDILILPIRELKAACKRH